MAKWKVRVTGKQRSALDAEMLLAAVLALGRQLGEEKRRRRVRETRDRQRTLDRAWNGLPSAGVSPPATTGREASS